MGRNRDDKTLSRRRLLGGLARGAAGMGAAAALSGCDPGTFWDYLAEEVDGVNDRFNESVSGHAKDLIFPESDAEAFTFLWAADIHITDGQPDHMDKMGAYAQQVGASFILHSGDCVDRGEEKEYQKWVTLMEYYFAVPMFSAIGNHDLFNEGWDRFKLYIGPSVFRFEYGACDFTFIDAANGTLGEDQIKWLEKVLERYRSRRCRFVLGHYPIYDGHIQTPSAMGYTQERMKLIYLFDEYNVDYYLCGHKHMNDLYKVRGVYHLLSGAGSAYKQVLNDDYHFYRFDINGDHISRNKVYFDDVELT